MDSAYWESLIRHALSAVGGFLVAQGLTDKATVEAIIGGAVALAALGWSLFHKKAIVDGGK